MTTTRNLHLFSTDTAIIGLTTFLIYAWSTMWVWSSGYDRWLYTEVAQASRGETEGEL